MLFLKRPNALERKLAANRRNALKLMGPRPSEGKKARDSTPGSTGGLPRIKPFKNVTLVGPVETLKM